MCISTQEAWERDLKITLPPSQWVTLWSSGIHLSKYVRYMIIQFKILYRAYVTPVRLAKMSENDSDLCWHNCGFRSSLLHLF